MTLRRIFSLLAVFAMCFAVYNPSLFGQGSDLGTIHGTVTDSSGAVIPHAQVQITDLGIKKVYNFKTDARGSYEAPDLVPGRYTATITAPGFSTSMVTGIVLRGSDVVQDDAVLKPASETQSVEVTAEQGSTINTENSTLSETLSPTAVLELPRDSRDIYQFLYINPNITQGDEPGDFKFIAAQSYGASFSVDGQRSSGGMFGQATQSEPSLESVGELNVLSNSFSAEYAGVANIRVNTKRGTADKHGSLFYNNSNSALAAWTISDKQNVANFAPTVFQTTYPRSRFNLTDAGGSFGGPIPKAKNTWFFLAYEHNWTVTPIAETDLSGVLHPTVQSGDFSLVNDQNKPNVPAGTALTPSEIATETVGGLGQQFIKIPQRLLNPITQKLVSLYFPSIGDSAPIDPLTGRIPSYSTSAKGTNSQNMGDLRIDHDFNEANRIYGVFHGSSQNTATSPVSAPYTGLGLLHNTRQNSTLSLSYTHVFSPRIVNEGRGGYNIQNYYIHSNTTVEEFLKSIGFTADDITAYGSVIGPQELLLHGNPTISFGGGISTFGSGGRSSDRQLNQDLMTFGDTLTWSIGRHMIKFGGDFVRNEAVDGFASSRGKPLGSLAYSGGGLNGYTNFLLGAAPLSVTYVALPRPAMDVHNWENGFYVQDDFRTTSRLTLNLGMRYDLYNPYIEKHDLLANFDPNYRNADTGQVGRDIVPSAQALKYLAPSITSLPPDGIGYALASNSGLGVGRGLVKTDKQDFGPRVGAAFRLNNKSVLRGGFGLYYPTSSAHIYRDSIGTNPFSQAATKRSKPNAPISGWPTGTDTNGGVSPINGGAVGGFGNVPSANYVPVDLKNPRLFEWNATYEHQIPWQTTLRASYIGGHQTGQIVGVDLDEIPPSDSPFGTTEDPTGNGNVADGHTPCDPTGILDSNGCAYSAADQARIKFPILGDYVIGFGNHGRSMTTSFQAQAERQARGLTFSLAYTLLDQNSSGVDAGNDSLGGDAYNPFQPNYDYTRDSYVSRHRVVAYAVYDLPVGRGRRFAPTISRVADAAIGGWQVSTNMFAKSGTGFTPFWSCGDCDPVMPGNVASGAIDAVGDFNTPSFRPTIIGNPTRGHAPGFMFNPASFGLPDIGSTFFSNPLAAKRNTLTGPGTYGVNLGLHKSLHVGERVEVQIGADFDNVLNHALLSPDQNAGGGGGYFANLGTFYLQVDQTTPPAPGKQPGFLPLNTTQGPIPNPVQPNASFGQLNNSFSQEGVSGNRTVRLRGRITF